jgi:hypothetical protein
MRPLLAVNEFADLLCPDANGATCLVSIAFFHTHLHRLSIVLVHQALKPYWAVCDPLGLLLVLSEAGQWAGLLCVWSAAALQCMAEAPDTTKTEAHCSKRRCLQHARCPIPLPRKNVVSIIPLGFYSQQVGGRVCDMVVCN